MRLPRGRRIHEKAAVDFRLSRTRPEKPPMPTVFQDFLQASHRPEWRHRAYVQGIGQGIDVNV